MIVLLMILMKWNINDSINDINDNVIVIMILKWKIMKKC